MLKFIEGSAVIAAFALPLFIGLGGLMSFLPGAHPANYENRWWMIGCAIFWAIGFACSEYVAKQKR